MKKGIGPKLEGEEIENKRVIRGIKRLMLLYMNSRLDFIHKHI